MRVFEKLLKMICPATTGSVASGNHVQTKAWVGSSEVIVDAVRTQDPIGQEGAAGAGAVEVQREALLVRLEKGGPGERGGSKAVPRATLGSPFSALIRVRRLIPARSASSTWVQRRARRPRRICSPRS